MREKVKSYELDRLLFKLKKDTIFQWEFLSNFDKACEAYSLTVEEKKALREADYFTLSKLGAKPELLLALARLLNSPNSRP